MTWNPPYHTDFLGQQTPNHTAFGAILHSCLSTLKDSPLSYSSTHQSRYPQSLQRSLLNISSLQASCHFHLWSHLFFIFHVVSLLPRSLTTNKGPPLFWSIPILSLMNPFSAKWHINSFLFKILGNISFSPLSPRLPAVPLKVPKTLFIHAVYQPPSPSSVTVTITILLQPQLPMIGESFSI